MKEYPYIGIILYEFYKTMRVDLIEDEMFFVTNVYEEPKLEEIEIPVPEAGYFNTYFPEPDTAAPSPPTGSFAQVLP